MGTELPLGKMMGPLFATFPRIRRARKVTELPSPREFQVLGPIPTDFLVGSLGLLTRVLSLFFSQIGWCLELGKLLNHGYGIDFI